MLAFSLHWLHWWRRAAAIGWRHADRLAALGDPRHVRNLWLAEVRRLSVEYMKTPQFLALMRFNLTLLTQPTLIKAARMSALPIR